jgi:ligand-binding sensor domain-containing protein
VWIGTAGGGLNRFRNGVFSFAGPTADLRSGLVWPVYEDREGRLWVGTEGGQLHCRVRGKWITYPRPGDPLFPEKFTSILQDRDGDIWIGVVGNKLYRLRNGRVSVYGSADGFSHDMARALEEDSEGNLWIATNQDLQCRKNDRFVTYTKREGLSSDRIVSLHAARDGALWIGTQDGGLNVCATGNSSPSRRRIGCRTIPSI